MSTGTGSAACMHVNDVTYIMAPDARVTEPRGSRSRSSVYAARQAAGA
jgi:hypothetical protein